MERDIHPTDGQAGPIAQGLPAPADTLPGVPRVVRLPLLSRVAVPRDHVFERRVEIRHFGAATLLGRAASLLEDCPRIASVLDRRGLLLSAEREEDLERPVAVLRAAFGDALRSSATGARLREGPRGPESPVLRVEVRCPRAHVETVRRDLQRRGARQLETSDAGGCGVVRTLLPAAGILGYARRLAQLTGGAGALSTRLAYYEAVEGEPPQPA